VNLDFFISNSSSVVQGENKVQSGISPKVSELSYDDDDDDDAHIKILLQIVHEKKFNLEEIPSVRAV
jgi:hypothetical protein